MVSFKLLKIILDILTLKPEIYKFIEVIFTQLKYTFMDDQTWV